MTTVYVACQSTECDYGCDTTEIAGVYTQRQNAEDHAEALRATHTDEHTFRVEEHELR